MSKRNQPAGLDLSAIEKKLNQLLQQGYDPQEAAGKFYQELASKKMNQPTLSWKEFILWSTAALVLSSMAAALVAGIFVFVFGGNEISKATAQIEELQTRVDQLEQAPVTPSTPTPPAGRFTLDLIVEPTNLSAGDQSHASVIVKVTDAQGQPAPDGTEIFFTPPSWGHLEPLQAATQNGQVQATFTADGSAPLPPNVSITAKTADNVTKGSSITIIEPKLNLALELLSSLDRELQPGETFNFIFKVTNQGNIPAQDVVLYSRIPDTVDLITSDHRQENGNLAWDIGEIPPGPPADRTLSVKVKPDTAQGSQVFSPEFWVQCRNCQEARQPAGKVILTVAARSEPQPSSIRLTSDGSPILSANDQDQFTVTAQILDQYEHPFTGTVTFTLMPENLGTLTPDGNVATFTAGSQIGTVKIVATFEGSTAEIGLTLTQPNYKFGEASILYGDPDERISTLPKGTPILKLEDDPQDNGFQKIALAIWVPKTAITNSTTISDIGAPVRVGETPNDPLNVEPLPTLLEGILEEPVEILDEQSQLDYVQIKVLGWIRPELIEEIQ